MLGGELSVGHSFVGGVDNPQVDSSYTDQFALGIDAELPEQIRASVTAFYNDGREIGVKVQNPEPGSDAPDLNLGGLGPTFELLLEKQLGVGFYRDNVGRAQVLPLVTTFTTRDDEPPKTVSIYPLNNMHVSAFWHIVLVGIPTAFFISRGLKQSQT